MISQKELEKEIKERENAPPSMRIYSQLADLRTIYDMYYGEPQIYAINGATSADKVVKVSESEFMRALNGKNMFKSWELMDELMSTVKIVNPRLYNSVMRKIEEQD